MAVKLSEKRNGQTQSVSRALSLLTKLSEEQEGLSLTELARRAELAPSTTHRLLTTLQIYQFVRFEDRRWFIGVQSSNIGASYIRVRDVCYTARSYLRLLMQKTGETSNLALFENDELIYQVQNEYPERKCISANPKAKVPLSCSAVGKVCLAFMPRQEADHMIARAGLSRLTRKSHITANSLWRDLEDIRKRRFSIDNEERSDGLRCVGAPLFGPNAEVIGALSVGGPVTRLSDQKLTAFGQIAQRASQDITKATGGVWPE